MKTILSLILVFCFLNSKLISEESKKESENTESAKLFIGFNLGYNSFEFHSYNEWAKWRPNNEFKKTFGFRFELILLEKRDLTFYSNAIYFNRTSKLPSIDFVSPTTLFERRNTEKSVFILSDFGFKYNLLNYKKFNFFPKLGFYLSQRVLDTFFADGEEYLYEEDKFQTIEVGFNLGTGLSYKVYGVKLILEYNFYDTFKDAPDQNEAFVFWNRNQSINLILGYEFGI